VARWQDGTQDDGNTITIVAKLKHILVGWWEDGVRRGKRRHILDSNLWLLKSQLQDVKFIVGSCEKVLAVLFCSGCGAGTWLPGSYM